MSIVNSSEKNIKSNANKYISKRGYIVRKSSLSTKELNDIKNELTVKPFVNSDYGKEEEPFKIYMENDTKIYLPKRYGYDKFGLPDFSELPPGDDINIEFNLNLKKEQIIPAEATIKAYRENGGGILSLPCGFGKTIMALYFIATLKKKTLVIVHVQFLMSQWIERIKFALPEAKIGTIQGSTFDIEGKDIVIGMLQTLSMRDFDATAFNSFGHIIIDECHHIPSRVFSKALTRITSQYMLGLSATPRRKDGLMKVVQNFIGDIVYSVKNAGKNVVKVERYLLESDNEDYKREVLNYMGKPQMPTMINNITEYYKRTEMIIDRILETVTETPERHVLVLSDRKKHLEDMFNICEKRGFTSVGYYVGGMKKDDLKQSESKQIILATCMLVAEGFDVPSLNTLVLTSPKSDIVQIIGRIDRKIHDNVQPLILDYVDNFSMFENQGRKRFAVYKKNKFAISDTHINIETKRITFSKNYKNISGNNSSDSEEIEDDSIISSSSASAVANYKKSNKKFGKNETDFESEKVKKQKDIDDLFKSMSMFA